MLKTLGATGSMDGSEQKRNKNFIYSSRIVYNLRDIVYNLAILVKVVRYNNFHSNSENLWTFCVKYAKIRIKRDIYRREPLVIAIFSQKLPIFSERRNSESVRRQGVRAS